MIEEKAKTYEVTKEEYEYVQRRKKQIEENEDRVRALIEAAFSQAIGDRSSSWSNWPGTLAIAKCVYAYLLDREVLKKESL